MSDDARQARERLVRMVLDRAGLTAARAETRRNLEDGELETVIRGASAATVRNAFTCALLHGWIIEPIDEDGPAVLAY